MCIGGNDNFATGEICKGQTFAAAFTFIPHFEQFRSWEDEGRPAFRDVIPNPAACVLSPPRVRQIYNGFAGFFDYGPLGVELKKNIKDAWWRDVVQARDDIVGLDSSIISNPKVGR